MLSSQHEAQQASLQRIEEFAQYIVRNNLHVSHNTQSNYALQAFAPTISTTATATATTTNKPPDGLGRCNRAGPPSSLKNEGVLPSDFLHPYSYRETAIGPSFIISTPTTPFPHEGRTSMYAALPTTASSSASVAGGSGRSRERRSSLSRGPKLAADSTLTPTQVPGSAATSIGVTKKGEKRKMAEVNRGPEGPSTSIGQSSGPKAKVPKLKHN
ncbi:hypothetical protein RHS01_07449 [Rhizoctonia solani]|uniref:Uncharacterized protein n=1 Tax=Rhizoctonia solani TaxID=456999 RepID=A0A8H7M3L6_9AGAM|nr:hypothetical protein RHS01_07449 [Rhizoctonia solani]